MRSHDAGTKQVVTLTFAMATIHLFTCLFGNLISSLKPGYEYDTPDLSTYLIR